MSIKTDLFTKTDFLISLDGLYSRFLYWNSSLADQNWRVFQVQNEMYERHLVWHIP